VRFERERAAVTVVQQQAKAVGHACVAVAGQRVGRPRDHVAHVHVKDAVAGPAYTLPGDGDARVADCLRLLLDNGYRGAFSLEPHLGVLPHRGMVHTPDAAARFVEAGTALRGLVTGLLTAVR